MLKIFKSLADKSSRHSRLAVVLFVLLLFAAPVIGYWIYNRQLDAQERQVQESLSRIAHIRAGTLSSFLHERIGDAQLSSSSPFLGGAISSWIQEGRQDDLTKMKIRERLGVFKKIYGYVEIAIFDTYGNVLISTEDIIRPIDRTAAQVIERVVTLKAIQISSIQPLSESGNSGRIINIGAPVIFGESQKADVEVVLLFKFDPQRQMYPALEGAPYPNLPNDVLVVEIRGQQVVSLSDAHFAPYRYLDVLPITPKQLLDSAAASTASLVWTADGQKEIGAAHAVEGVPWFVTTMVAKNAVNAIVRETAQVAVATSGVTLCVLGIGILLWWRYRESEFKLEVLQTETNRRLLQKKYDYLSKYANDMIILTDADSDILEMNDTALQALGYFSSSLIGQPITILSPPSDCDQLKEHLNHLHREGAALFETYLQRCDGTAFPTEVSARAIRFEGQSFSQFICRDITERKEAESKIQSLAYYDNVTSLPNRVLLNDRLDQAIHMATRSTKKVGLLFLDLDNFKNVNDSLGHQIGDNLLHSVGRRLLGCVREEDTVARIGGDEFMVLLPDLDRGEEARHVAEKIIATFARPFLLHDHQIYTTTSIGISLFPNDSKQVPDLIKFADSALYEAKSHGRNNYQFFTQELNDQITRNSKIERRLRHAMEVGELSLWYQPQIDVRDGKVIGAEALLRWRDGNPDLFMPAEFIAVAEERGLITKLGEWTIREACKQCRIWQAKGLRIVPIAVNVSPIQLQQKEFAELVLAILRDSGLDASFLELEITETSIMRSAQMVAELAVRLRDSGVRISIDDFGTGYSSLSFLKHIPIDKIKIDRSFIRDMLSDAEDETITQAIVSLGQSMQLRVIAEGVESQAQMERLLSLGCHEAQGFFYSHAVSSETFQNFLEKGWHFAAAIENEPA
jgi:diguanylate cyclase (GGDEF)-like protein/PAS domain S-box-containing protein